MIDQELVRQRLDSATYKKRVQDALRLGAETGDASPFMALLCEVEDELASEARTREIRDFVVGLSRRLRRDRSAPDLSPEQIDLFLAAAKGATQGAFPFGCSHALSTILLPVFMDAKHPMIVLPASLLAKYRQHFEELREHWLLPILHLVSVEMLNRNPNFLAERQPDTIITNVQGARGASQALAHVREWAAQNGAKMFELEPSHV